jgi:hypothetical protein
MNVGMLWFDNDAKADLFAKIERAASYYQDKYGKSPNICYVHPSMTHTVAAPKENAEPIRAGAIEVRTTKSVLPNHLWIGVNGLNGHITS